MDSSMQAVKQAFVDYLTSKAPIINEAFSAYGMSLQQVYSYEKHSIVVDEFPCIVLENPRRSGTPLCAPYVIEHRYEIPITGFVVYDDPETKASMITDFADQVTYALSMAPDLRIPTNLSAAGVPVTIHPGPENLPPFMPDYQISYQATPDERVFLHIFEANLVGFIDASLGAIA